MTGPEDFFGGLDDQTGTPANPPAIDTVISRGRQIRFRRYALATGSAAVLSTAVAVAAFGVVPGIDAAPRGHQLTPAQQPSATATATAAPHKHGGKTVLTVRPGTRHTPVPTHSASPSPSSTPVSYPCATPSPQQPASDPLGTAPPSPAATDDGATPPPTCESPSPEPSGTPSSSPPPSSATPSPTSTPLAQASAQA